MESIMADDVIAARSERAVRCAARRWGLALGIGKPHRASTRSSKSSAACVDSASKSILCIGLRYCGRLTVEASEVVMSEQHAALLKKARERLVEDRRSFAQIIAAPFERERTNDARVRFIEMQVAIEAVDRAIEDEENDDKG